MEPTVLAPHDPRYPALLAAVASPPTLWVRGVLERDDALAVAVVGTRRATPYGVHVAEQLAQDLAARGVVVVSGLARGIDTGAHRGALAAGGRTIAVLGCGIDRVYPPENAKLALEIERRGLVVSQFAPGAPPLAGHFPARNRTLAALALGVVVVEAPERSGALITAGFAADLGREVFAVPGRIGEATSAGPHGLLIEGAKLVRDWADIVQELPDPWRRLVRAPRDSDEARERPDAQTEEGRVLAMLAPDEPQHIETLLARSGGDAARVSAALVTLELGGWARQLEGQRWVRAAVTAGRT